MSDDPALPAPRTPSPSGPAIGPDTLRRLRGLSVASCVLVGTVGVLNLVSIPNDLAYLGSLQDVVDGDFSVIEDIEDQEDLRAMFGVLSLIGLVVTGVVWIIWQQRARKCTRALGAGGLRHSEPLAIFGWIIPIGNLFLPKQVTNDLWRGSDPEAPAAMNVAGRPVWGVINVWWAAWIVGGVIGRILFRADEPQDLEDLEGFIDTVRLGVAASLLVVVSTVLGILVVTRITGRVLERAARTDGIAI